MSIQRQPTPHPNQPVNINKNPNQVSSREILVIYDVPLSPDNAKNRIALRICQWNSNQTKNGEPIITPITLEKRRYYRLKDGTVRWGKAMGFTIDDIKVISERQDEIIAALQS